MKNDTRKCTKADIVIVRSILGEHRVFDYMKPIRKLFKASFKNIFQKKIIEFNENCNFQKQRFMVTFRYLIGIPKEVTNPKALSKLLFTLPIIYFLFFNYIDFLKYFL